MGFDWIYVNPLNYTGFSGSLYAIKDFYKFNPLFAPEDPGGEDPTSWAPLVKFIDACHERLQFSGIMVTHEVPKIFEIVNKVIMLHEGGVLFFGTPEEMLSSEDEVVQAFVAAGAKWVGQEAACHPPGLDQRKKDVHML